MTELLFLAHTQLKIHPRNVRIYYPPADVAEMAGSLLATAKSQPAGNIQALLVVPAAEESPGTWFVVDGNLRLMAGRSLGDACPPFKCEPIEAGQAEQLLLMAATGLHYPKDPISEGRHYRRLQEEEGYSIRAIAAATGLSATTIAGRLSALDLEEPIQEMMMRRELPADARLIRALLSLPDSEQRLSVAGYYARRNVAIGSMLRRIRGVVERVHRVNGTAGEYAQAQDKNRAKTQAATEARLRNRAAGLDGDLAETVWRLAGEFLCEGCKLEGLGAECYLCPGPQEFIEHLVEMTESARAQESVSQEQTL